jgi:hypothetical protein
LSYELSFPSGITSGIRKAIEVSPSISGVLFAKVKLDAASDHEVYLSRDGQLEGIFLTTTEPHRKGTSFIIEVGLPWGETMTVEGVVAWSRTAVMLSLVHRPGMGVKLTGLLPEQTRLLERALLLREPMPFPLDVLDE